MTKEAKELALKELNILLAKYVDEDSNDVLRGLRCFRNKLHKDLNNKKEGYTN